MKKPNNFFFSKNNYTFITNLIILPSAQPIFFLTSFSTNKQTESRPRVPPTTNFIETTFQNEPINTNKTDNCLFASSSIATFICLCYYYTLLYIYYYYSTTFSSSKIKIKKKTTITYNLYVLPPALQAKNK